MNTIHYLKNIINARIIVNSMLIELHTKLNTIGTVIQFPSYSNLDLRDAKVNIILDIVKEHVIFESSLELYHELHPTIAIEEFISNKSIKYNIKFYNPDPLNLLHLTIKILKFNAAGLSKDPKCLDFLDFLYYYCNFNIIVHRLK